MRASFFPKLIRPLHLVPRWPGLAVGLLGSVLIVTAGASEDATKKAAKLGFAFDQHAHDVAVAAANAKAVGDSHAADALADGLLQLPKYTVTEKPVRMQAREVLSPTGKVDLAKKTYLSPAYEKTIGILSAVAALINDPKDGWQPNGPEAMALYEDTQQLRRKIEMQGLLDLQATADPGK
jgi:hypothetical protein